MEDLIRRSDAIDVVRVAYFDKDIQSAKDDPCIVDAMTDWAIRQIKSLPSADRPQGKWIDGKCSLCGKHAPYWAMATTYYKSNYCPSCGARMKGADDEYVDRRR